MDQMYDRKIRSIVSPYEFILIESPLSFQVLDFRQISYTTETDIEQMSMSWRTRVSIISRMRTLLSMVSLTENMDKQLLSTQCRKCQDKFY